MVLQGGSLDIEDLKNFKVRVMDAWKVPLGEADLHVAPPPAGGALLAFILRLMKGFQHLFMMFHFNRTMASDFLNVGKCLSPLLSAEFDLTPDDLGGDHRVKIYHHYIEVAKFANGQKRSIRDPQFNNPKVWSLPRSKPFFCGTGWKFEGHRFLENSLPRGFFFFSLLTV